MICTFRRFDALATGGSVQCASRAARVPRPTEIRLSEQIRRVTGAREVEVGERIQSLWGGYGELRRVRLQGARIASAIVKSVSPPAEQDIARDPAKLRSHRRKLRSYAVELAFYEKYGQRCDAACRVPRLLKAEARDNRFLFLLEDLDDAGFCARRTRCSSSEIAACLRWLAAFHGCFLGDPADGLWKVGCYWHLATRPDELLRVDSQHVRHAAAAIDARLGAARFRSLVHGDAKLENFCFSPGAQAVAAVDFQYVGGGVGVKDVAYFLSSCLSPAECEAQVPGYLDLYFDALRAELSARGRALGSDAVALEAEWRALVPWAWADFQRCLLGWAPAHAATERYGEKQLSAVLATLR